MRGDTKAFLAGAFHIGLGHGWVAWRTGSIRWTVLTHLLTAFLGLGGLLYFGKLRSQLHSIGSKSKEASSKVTECPDDVDIPAVMLIDTRRLFPHVCSSLPYHAPREG